MKKIFRDIDNKDYWDLRWRNNGVDERGGGVNLCMYPFKYIQPILFSGADILEAGCGAGRVYFYYSKLGYNIRGIDYSGIAINNILSVNPNAKVSKQSILNLSFKDSSFDIVLAFGLFHNFENENDLVRSFEEAKRVLRKDGILMLSVRYDSLENRLIEKIIKKRSFREFDKFHKMHFELEDIKRLLGDNMSIVSVHYARNVSFLFKFNFFRAKELKDKNFVEKNARSKGFKLNWLGEAIDIFLHLCFPRYFSNLLIIEAKKH